MQESQHMLWRLENAGTYLIMGSNHPNKPGKMHVVFDLGAEFHGISINKALLSGSDKPNSWGIAAIQERASCSYW